MTKRTDTERLDWLVGSDNMLVVKHNPDRTRWSVWDQGMGLCLAGNGDTMRQAIDDCMDNYVQGVWRE